MKVKTIKEFPDYEISDTGVIISNKRNKQIIMTPKIDKDGYLVIGLRNNNKKYFRNVHRLVALAFIPNFKNKEQVNHKDGNRKNNNVNNLEWVTVKENIQHCFWVLGRKGEHTTSIQCKLYFDNQFIRKFDDIKSACKYAEEVYKVSFTYLQKNKKSGKCLIEIEEGQETIM